MNNSITSRPIYLTQKKKMKTWLERKLQPNAGVSQWSTPPTRHTLTASKFTKVCAALKSLIKLHLPSEKPQ